MRSWRLTPAAVGQQRRALEDMLGVVLFRRTPKGLELTAEADAGLDALRSGFLQFEESVRAMQSGQSSHNLTIAVPRDLTEKWLQEKLVQFSNDNPEVSFSILSADADVDFTEANLDVAIRLSDGPGEHEGVLLGTSDFITIKGKGLAAGSKIDWPGCPTDDEESATMRVSDAGLAVEAAVSGFGQCAVTKLVAQRDLANGRIEQVRDARPSSRGYWLIAPLPQ